MEGSETEQVDYETWAKTQGAEAFIVTGPGQVKEGYSVREVAQRFPQSVEEVIDVLSKADEQARPKRTPHGPLGTYSYTDPVCEFVPLDHVVGGNYQEQHDGNTTWLVDAPGHERKHRGAPRILELIRKFEDGKPFSPYSPLRVEKHGDEYYIGPDGRHRVAALKAMGVTALPMVVVEAKTQG